jgi:hypothetical protein
VTEQTHDEVLEQSIVDEVNNKYTMVINAAIEAKKIKALDKDKTANLGKITLEALNKMLAKQFKKQNKEKEKEKGKDKDKE